jgi:hypothetical protein
VSILLLCFAAFSDFKADDFSDFDARAGLGGFATFSALDRFSDFLDPEDFASGALFSGPGCADPAIAGSSKNYALQQVGQFPVQLHSLINWITFLTEKRRAQ